VGAGLEAAATCYDEAQENLEVANAVVLAIFVIELLLKVCAEGRGTV
jgi:hypothetical protein